MAVASDQPPRRVLEAAGSLTRTHGGPPCDGPPSPGIDLPAWSASRSPGGGGRPGPLRAGLPPRAHRARDQATFPHAGLVPFDRADLARRTQVSTSR